MRDLRKFAGWRKAASFEVNRYLPDAIKAELQKQLENDDVVFLQEDLSVTRSMFPGEQVIFASDDPEWRSFCETL